MAYLHRAGLAGIYCPHHSPAFPGRNGTVQHMLPAIRARCLDLEAGVELAQGHVEAAERLAWRAAELRGQA